MRVFKRLVEVVCVWSTDCGGFEKILKDAEVEKKPTSNLQRTKAEEKLSDSSIGINKNRSPISLEPVKLAEVPTKKFQPTSINLLREHIISLIKTYGSMFIDRALVYLLKGVGGPDGMEMITIIEDIGKYLGGRGSLQNTYSQVKSVHLIEGKFHES